MTDPLSVLPTVQPDPPGWISPMLAHLTELRARLLWCVATTLVFTIITCGYSETLTRFLLTLAPKGVVFIQLGPGEAFMASLKISLIAGVVTSLPMWLYHTGCFILPGLHAHEKNRLLGLITAGIILFGLGCAFGLWVIGPQTTSWLMSFGDNLAINQLSIARYLDFIIMLVLLTGISCELPMVIIGGVELGLIPRAVILSRWREGIIGVFLAAAILTPGQDPFSMVLVGGALVLLYAASLGYIAINHNNKQRNTN